VGERAIERVLEPIEHGQMLGPMDELLASVDERLQLGIEPRDVSLGVDLAPHQQADRHPQLRGDRLQVLHVQMT
jgi:hypothetical protein